MRCLLLALTLAACGAPSASEPRTVFVDTALPYSVLSAAAEAAGQWNDAAGAVLGGATAASAPSPGQIWVTSGDLPPDVLARTLPPGSAGTIVVQISARAFDAANTWGLDGLLVHELGHAMGLGHSIHGEQDVMHATCAPNWAITESDVRELRILRESGAFWSVGEQD